MKPLLSMALTVGAAVAFAAVLHAQTPTFAYAIGLPAVTGRIDHFALEPGRRLFVAALGHGTVEVIDLATRKVVHSLPGLAEPQGIAFVGEFNRLYIANGGDGTVRMYDGTTFAAAGTIKFDDDADNVRYDAASRQILVGYGDGGLGIVDAQKGTLVATVPLAAHPESFQFEPGGPRVFVNVPRAHQVAVVDRRTHQTVATWPLGAVAANFPLALDSAGHRAFVGCRSPARLLVFDTESGRELARLELHGDCDDLFYDAKRKQVYASCGEGFIDVFACAGPTHCERQAAVRTVAGARTSFFDGERIYLAVPRRGGADAEVRVYTLAERE